jgi:hypothetical protein
MGGNNPEPPSVPRMLRWIPDVYESLAFTCSRDDLDRRIEEARLIIRTG